MCLCNRKDRNLQHESLSGSRNEILQRFLQRIAFVWTFTKSVTWGSQKVRERNRTNKGVQLRFKKTQGTDRIADMIIMGKEEKIRQRERNPK